MLELILSIALGVGLSAAVGLRVFAPFTVLSLAALTGQLELTDSFAWIGTYPALITFTVAMLVEILAYYVPWLDNVLDMVAAPAAVIAGAVATASVMTDMSPQLRWTLAIIAGGGAAGIVQMGTAVLRGASLLTTGGLANPLVATGEWAGAIVTTVLSLLFPLATLIVIVLVLLFLGRKLVQRRRQPDMPEYKLTSP